MARVEVSLNIRATAARVLEKTKTRKRIAQLHAQNEPCLKALSDVFDDVVENRLSIAEVKLIDGIETLRSRLDRSSDRISISDFGARSPQGHPTAEEMHHGRVVRTTVGDVCRTASVPYEWGLLLFKVIRKFRPSVCLELGTALGISTAFQAAALELNGQGHVVSLEGANSLADLARENFERLGLTRATVVVGRFQDTLQEVLEKRGPIDFAFIDGHHDEAATLLYSKQIGPFLTEHAIIALDDIWWSRGMNRAWDSIRNGPNILASVDTFRFGLCILSRAARTPKHFQIGL